MRYHVLATDYDGTLAQDGAVPARTVEALERLRRSGRRLVLVTGRELTDLERAFDRLDLFDRVVAENGAMLYRPETREQRQLAEPPPEELIAALGRAGVEPLSMGRVVVATDSPNAPVVLEVIHRLGLELQLVFNKGSLMVLPATVNKATGLASALDELALSPHDAVGVGDAENDHAFLAMCEASVAVANALPMLKETADLVTDGARGDGVAELIGRLLGDGLGPLDRRPERREILLGHREDGSEERLAAHGPVVLVAGPSGSGKSTLVTGIVERLLEHAYQVCLIDPEGDYRQIDDAVVLGDVTRAPALTEILDALARPGRSVVANLVAVPIADRPGFCQGLLPRLHELRATTGRPHWIVVDEAHHLLPADWRPAGQVLTRDLFGLLAITVHPQMLSAALLETTTEAIAVGRDPAGTLEPIAAAWRADPVSGLPPDLPAETAARWCRGDGAASSFVVEPAHAERLRHRRKYAAGQLPEEVSFWFRGPRNRLNLRAQNLQLFAQIAAGVDEETWLHHLRRGDYAGWFHDVIKDEHLAGVARATQEADADDGISADESRRRILSEIDERYTAPA